MQVFKAFMKVTKKRIHFAMIYVAIFIGIGFILSANATVGTDFESRKLDVSVIDMDNTEASKSLTEYIGLKHELIEIEDNKDKIVDSLFYAQVDYVLVINKGYGDKLSKGEAGNLFSNYKISDTYTSTLIETQLDEYVKSVSSYIAGGITLEQAVIKAEQLAENEVKVEIVDFSTSGRNDYNKYVASYYQYLVYVLLCAIITGLSPTLLVMFKKEIRNRTNCSCVSNTSQMIQIVAGTVIFSICLYAIIVLFALIFYGGGFLSQRGLLAMLNGFVFLLFAIMLTFFISLVISSQRAVNMVSNTIGLGMSFLCGAFVPQELLSDTVLNIGKFFPAYWYIKINNMLSGASGETLTTERYITYIGIQLAFVVAFFCLTLLISKTKRRAHSV